MLRWDVRGFGLSDKPPGPYSASLFAADLARAARCRSACERVHLGGLSMGGVIAQRFALDHPQRVRSLMLVSTSSEVGPQGAANWQRLADRIEQRGFGDRRARRLARLLAGVRRRASRRSSPPPARRRRATIRTLTPLRRAP